LSLIFYKLFILLYQAGIHLASTWNNKAGLMLAGRKNSFNKIKKLNTSADQKLVWMHCASLGEFEQGRPVLEAIKEAYPRTKILLSFFSPSGYEIRKNYALADQVIYLPADNATNANQLIEAAKPDLVIWVKYEYWYFYLSELRKRNIPVILVSGIFRDTQPFFKPYGSLWRKMLSFFDHIFLQNESSKELLASINFKENVTISGDTRFDRVIEIAENEADLSQQAIDFCRGSKVLVAGSTWEPDEAELVHFIKSRPAIRFIIAPHEIHTQHLSGLQKRFNGHCQFYSEVVSNGIRENINLLIIDNIGMLSKLYRLATVTYIGGGFGEDGIHNVLEAAVYGKPVIFGPVHEKFAEAVNLVEIGGAYSVKNAIELEKILDSLFNNEEHLRSSSNAAREFVYDNRGATKKIMSYIQEKRLLIS